MNVIHCYTPTDDDSEDDEDDTLDFNDPSVDTEPNKTICFSEKILRI